MSPNGVPFELPEFPTLFPPEDVERLRKLEEQRKQMEEVYRGKFTPEEWAKVPAPEKAVRKLLPPWAAPVAKVLTPWEWGWEFGFTPEQAEKERLELEEEYKELTRRERVTRLLPPIKATLRALALTDADMVTDIGELRSIFKLDELGFSEEEAGYISSFAQRLIRATPEEIVSGEVFEMPPLSQEEVDELARTAIQPRQVLTTVALSKNLEDITAALQEMYAPQVVDDTRREAIIKEFAEGLKGATKEGTGEAFRKIAEEEGEVLVLTDVDTGTMVSASKRADNTVWVEGELIGSYDVGTQQIVPINLYNGQPLATEEEQESVLKDLWDSFYLGIHQAWYGTREALLNVIPQAVVNVFTPATEEQLIAEGRDPDIMRGFREGLQRQTTGILESLKQGAELRQAEHGEWLKDHPELAPRPEYTQSPIEHPELLADPYFYAYTITSNAPIIGAALFVGLATTLATKNPWAGAVAGAAAITPVQINSVYEDLIANGADPANATVLATSVGVAIGAVEILPGMIVLKSVSPAFMGIFRKNLQREVTKQVVTRLSARGILTTVTKIELAETLEEVIQESMQNAAVQTVNENRSLVENLPETAINAAIATLPLALLGGGSQYVAMKRNLPPAVQQEIDTTADTLVEAGLSEEHAEAVAYSKLLETETGQAAVLLAIEQVDEQIPVAPIEKASKVDSLEKKLTDTNNDIERFSEDIVTQEGRLEKTTLPSERTELTETIDGMKETISELTKQKAVLTKQLGKLQKVEVPEVVTEVIEPEVPLPEEEQIPYRARPRQLDWEDERAGVEETEAKPNISPHIRVEEDIREARVIAERTWNEADEEQRKAIRKQADLSKNIIAKEWSDMTLPEQQALTLASFPNGSLKMPGWRQYFDMEYYMEFLEGLTGLPFYSSLRRIEAAAGIAETIKERVLKRLTEDPIIAPARKSLESKVRVGQELNARNEVQGVEHVDNLTEAEIASVDALQDIYEEYKPKVRYLRVMDTVSTIEAFREEFPDAVEGGKESELEFALNLKEMGNLDDLWAYLYNLDWGVIEHGFDPRFIAAPQLRTPRHKLRATRGKGRMMKRTSIEYPEDRLTQNDPFIRASTYIEQMEIQWQVAPEIDTFGDMWEQVYMKLDKKNQVELGLKEWLNRTQGIGMFTSWFDKQISKLWRQSMLSIFIEPVLSLRNSAQAIMFHPDRTELFRLVVQKLPADLSTKGQYYFDTFVSQLGGLRRDYLHTGQPGFLIPDIFNRFADSINLYGQSDYYPRLWSFKAALNKARRATEVFLRDNDTAKWLKESGVVHLRPIEQNHVLTHFLGQADKNFNLGIAGLEEVTGADMASLYVAQRIADITHFKYRRSARGIMEMGVTGRTIWNLVVFSRGYAQRVYFQADKVRGVFSGETSWNEARTGFNDIMKLVVASLLMDQLYYSATGRKRNPYFILNILFGWQFGGLFIGMAQDAFSFFNDIVAVGNPLTDEEARDYAWGRLVQTPTRLLDALVPIYKRVMDNLDIIYETTNMDKYWLRKIREVFDKDYTPEELEELDRSLWEKIQKGLLGAQTPDPTMLEQIQTNLQEAGDKLGTQDVLGRYYTVREFGGEIKSLTKDIPDALLTEGDGYTDLVLFYKECEVNWSEYDKLPSSPASIRKEWRETHIEEEAMLLFWGKFATSVYRQGTPEWEQVSSLLRTWFSYHSIDARMHSKYADWTLPVKEGVDKQ